MNIYLLISGVLIIAMGIAHSIIGERSIIGPIQKTEVLPSVRGSITFTKRTLRFAWHVTSVFGFGIAIILLHYGRFSTFNSDQIFVLRTLSLTLFISFLVSVIGARAKHPSWIIFALAAVLVWISTTS
jgi:hypothetical protein